jgi:hypothetical protein
VVEDVVLAQLAVAVADRDAEIAPVAGIAEVRRRFAVGMAAGARDLLLAPADALADGGRVVEGVHEKLVGDRLDARDGLPAGADVGGVGGHLEEGLALLVVALHDALADQRAPGEVLLDAEDVALEELARGDDEGFFLGDRPGGEGIGEEVIEVRPRRSDRESSWSMDSPTTITCAVAMLVRSSARRLCGSRTMRSGSMASGAESRSVRACAEVAKLDLRPGALQRTAQGPPELRVVGQADGSEGQSGIPSEFYRFAKATVKVCRARTGWTFQGRGRSAMMPRSSRIR